MPVPRRFDRRPPERDLTRVNERIRVPEVRLIDDEGAQVGVMKIADALRFAQERELDLVEVAPEARPPVCRVLDYSKYKYEQAQKQKQARKHQQQITVREIKFRPKIAQHDYDTKKGHVERFLRHKDKVKVTIMFRGREVTHPERGTAILDRLAEELTELGVVEQRPLQEGRNMTMLLAPSKAVLAGKADSSASDSPAVKDDSSDVSAGRLDGASEDAAESPENGASAPDGAAATENGAGGASAAPAESPATSEADAAVESPAAGEADAAAESPANGESDAAVESPAAAESAPDADGATAEQDPAESAENGANGQESPTVSAESAPRGQAVS